MTTKESTEELKNEELQNINTNLELCRTDILTSSTQLNNSFVNSCKGIIKKLNEHKKSGEKRFLTVWSEIEHKIDKTNKEVLHSVENGFELSKSLAEANLSTLNETTKKSSTDIKIEIKQNGDLLKNKINEINEIVQDYKNEVKETIESKFRNFDKKFQALQSKSEGSNANLIKTLFAEEKQGLKIIDGKFVEIKEILSTTTENKNTGLIKKIDDIKQHISTVIKSNIKDSMQSKKIIDEISAINEKDLEKLEEKFLEKLDLLKKEIINQNSNNFKKIEETIVNVKDNVKETKNDIGSRVKENNSKVMDRFKLLDDIKQVVDSNTEDLKILYKSLINNLEKNTKDQKDNGKTIDEIQNNLTMQSVQVENLVSETETQFQSIKNQLTSIENTTKKSNFKESNAEFIKDTKTGISDIAVKVETNTSDINLIRAELVVCRQTIEKMEKNMESIIGENKNAIEYISKICECILKNQVKISKMDKKKLDEPQKKSSENKDNNNNKEDTDHAEIQEVETEEVSGENKGSWLKSMFTSKKQ